MPLSIEEQILAVRKAGGYLFLDSVGLIEISGVDAGSYLHGRSSNDVNTLVPGQGQLNSLLERKGQIIAFFSLHKLADHFLLFTQLEQVPTILSQFETYHFREQVEFKDLSSSYSAIAVQGPLSQALLNKGLTQPTTFCPHEFDVSQLNLWNKDCIVIKRSLCGEPGYVVLLDPKDKDTFLSALQEASSSLSMVPITKEALNVLRVEAGLPLFNTDMSNEELLPETGLEQYAASYSKGCFQGQEVLARIKTYGAPRRALVGLIFDDARKAFVLNTKFSINNEDSGTIKSSVYSPTLAKIIALAYISREYRVPDKSVVLQTENGTFSAKVSFLPLFTPSSNKERAKKLFDAALAEFASGSEEKAIKILRETIETDPLFADAYESLGVILSRQEQLDEAIAVMHKLEQLDPDSVMAHSNLSLFYMQQGDKEKAEEEKAIAMSKIAKEVAAKQQEDKNKAQQMEEAKERMSMFQQVLEIDSEDLLANYGLGNIYVELEEYEQSLPYLLKAIEVKPTHTVAYLALAKAYESLKRMDEATATYQSGIEVAAKRGDITPMNEMKSRLQAMTHKAT